MLKPLRNSLLSLFYPQQCRVCSALVIDADDGVACAACWEATRLFDDTNVLCVKCGAVLSVSGSPAGLRCHRCDEHLYDRAAAVGVYEKALAVTVVELKTTPFVSRNVRIRLRAAFDRAGFGGATLIIPVPLSKKRLIERGFNQADILVAALTKATGIPTDRNSLIRKTDSPIHRVGMDNRARELTVRNSFTVARPKLIGGQNILLVDDVFTSGATSSNCAKVLKKCGADRVNVLTLARAVIDEF